MSKAYVYHIQINVSNATRSFPFYKKLFLKLGYRIMQESRAHIGATNGATDFWIRQSDKPHAKSKYHRKAPGLNHISFRVFSKKTVQSFAKSFLGGRKTLYESPKHFPDYQKGYYAVYFEDPDRIKLEVTYIPPKKAGK